MFKRVLAALPLAALLGLALVSAPAAFAAPGDEGTTTPVLQVNSPTPLAGSAVQLTGSGYIKNENVKLTLHTKTYNLGSVKADKAGGFTTTVTLPAGVTGQHVIFGNGAKGDSASTAVTIGASAAIDAASTSGRGIDGAALGPQGSGYSPSSASSTLLSTTGVAVFSLVGLAILLLVAGAFFVISGRRKASA